MKLTVLNELPRGFLTTTALDLHEILPGPTLIHLSGRRAQPLFVSILLHGNEDTGLRAIQQVLRRYEGKELPRALSLFIGNIDAARAGVRRLEGQPDYNRVWPGTEMPDTPEASLMANVFSIMRDRQPFASIDIHNNTGRNPHYSCVSELTPQNLYLATLFSRIVVFFTCPRGVQCAAMNTICPSITVECGKVGAAAGDEHAATLVDAALHLAEFPVHGPHKHDVDIYHTVVTVKVPSALSFGFGTPDRDLNLLAELDCANFVDQQPGVVWGTVRAGLQPFDVTDENGGPVSEPYFAVDNDRVRLLKPVMPAMLTLDERAVRQDCLCYLMERVEYPAP